MEALNNYYLHLEEPNKSCMLLIRDLILGIDDNISETMKYKLPCFTINKKHFCYLNIDKKTNEPYILFVDGNMLNYPELEFGTRSRMKALRVNSDKDVDVEKTQKILKDAINLRTIKS